MDAGDFGTVGVMAELDEAEREALAPFFRLEQHPVGTPLTIEHDAPTKLFVLLEGHATVHHEGRHLRDLGPGDIIGEIGVLSMKERTATVLATTPVTVAVTMGWDLRDHLDSAPHLKARLEALAASHPDLV